MPGGVHVLLVEDDPDECDLLYETLTFAGAHVSVASSGHRAFGAFMRDAPDVVVSDLRMSDGDGYELIQRIRALPQEDGGLVPAVAISAANNGDAALRAGFHAFVAKPLDPQAVVDQVDDFVRTESGRQRVAAWTIRVTDAGVLTVTLDGHLRAADMRQMMAAFLVHLKRGTCDLVVDVRRLTGVSPAVQSIGRRSLWAVRHQVRYVLVVGAPRAARIVLAAALKVLGIPCTFAGSL